MTKPRLVKVRALFYVLQQIQKEAAPILTQPLCVSADVAGGLGHLVVRVAGIIVQILDIVLDEFVAHAVFIRGVNGCPRILLSFFVLVHMGLIFMFVYPNIKTICEARGFICARIRA